MSSSPSRVRETEDVGSKSRPSFFIVGAPKCGTTALYTYLRRHPDVFLTTMREPMYFGSDLHCSPGRRLTLSEYLALFSNVGNAQWIGECSTRYLVSRRAAEEIHCFNPAARIIIMLRQPVEMMHSLHAQLLYSGEEHLDDFEAALQDEPRRRKLIEKDEPPPIPQVLAYRYMASYAQHVERYFSVFGRDRVHVVIFEDLIRDTARAYRDVLDFIGATPSFRPSFEVVNQYKTARSRQLHHFLVRRMRPVRRRRHTSPARLLQGAVCWARELNTRQGPRPPLAEPLRRRLDAELGSEIDRLEILLRRDLSLWRERT